MYKTIYHGNSKIEIREDFRKPTVYLDHWALDDISLDDSLRWRFVNTMDAKGGTFRLSVANIAELLKQADRSQVDSILGMIKSIDDCGLINIDHGEVIKKENLLICDPSAILKVGNPSAEIDMVVEYLKEHNYPSRWHVSDIIASVIGGLPSKRMSRRNTNFLREMKRLLKIGRNDPKHFKRAQIRFKRLKSQGPQFQTATREISQMALDFVIRNKDMKMSKYSEWGDLFHVIVPVSYCDVVLIDRRWKAFISQTDFSYPKIAKVFDKRSLEAFFQTIENWESKN